ncbi:M23 family metallopeptidase [Bacteroides sp. 519]|uniref:M23 family metallopeptidase n=1 Tax=Bacteroides sp. 519 TaxID=2302937 RepID=UPI0019402460|nr:M23 family metallopeptidase [Bacteroides sp. 519]
MAKKKKWLTKALWHNFKFKYKISIFNENTLEEIAAIHVSKLNGLSVLLTVLIVLFAIAAAIIAFTPLRNYLPGYMNSEVRSQIMDNILRMDSLENVLERQKLYIMNIHDIFSGNIKPDTITSMENLTAVREDSLLARSEREEEFRKQYEEAEKYNLTTAITIQTQSDGVIFFPPTRGVISSSFDEDISHLGIDIAANLGESVVAVLEGTVILSTYTAETGNVIMVQHSQEFVSVYKHCEGLLKKVGDQVKAGESIALVGNTGTLTTGPHLHFELWHRGKAVNPTSYIVF